MTTATARIVLALALLLAGGTPAAGQHGGDMLIGSTVNNGGALAIQFDFGPKIQLAPSVTIAGTTVYTTTDPGFDAILADAGGFFVLNNNTQVSVQLLSFDAGASVKVHSTVLDTVNESAVLGTYTNAAPDGLHHHPTWTLTLPNGVFGDYDLAFRLTTTSGSYTASQTYAVVLTNATPAPTATATPSTTPTASPTSTATATTIATPTPTFTVAAATPTPTAPGATSTPTATPTPGPVCAVAPLAGCRTPTVAGKSSLVIVDKADDAKDTLQWKLQKGPITPKADYGDPLATTGWSFCLYDSGGALMTRAEIPAGGLCAGKPCWKSAKTFFKYLDKELSPDGVHQVQLKEGLKAGKSGQSLKGKGVALDLPAFPLPPAAFPLTAQLQGNHGLCFETDLGLVKKNTESKLVVKD
jgi:hypothetical protein